MIDGDTVEFYLCMFKMSFLRNVLNIMILIVKWCSGIVCNWCVSLDIAIILA